MQKVKTDKMLSKLGQLNDEQFKVLFFIYNTLNLNSDNTNRVKIYRAVLADLTGKSVRTISRITDILDEKGLIVKDDVSDGSKLYNYYSLPVTKNEEKIDNEKQKTDEKMVTDGRVKGPERTLMNIKELNEHKSTEKDLKELKYKIENKNNNILGEIGKNKFQLLEEYIEECYKDVNTYQDSVSQIGLIHKWIKDRYSSKSNVESLTSFANGLINKKLEVYKTVSH